MKASHTSIPSGPTTTCAPLQHAHSTPYSDEMTSAAETDPWEYGNGNGNEAYDLRFPTQLENSRSASTAAFLRGGSQQTQSHTPSQLTSHNAPARTLGGDNLLIPHGGTWSVDDPYFQPGHHQPSNRPTLPASLRSTSTFTGLHYNLYDGDQSQQLHIANASFLTHDSDKQSYCTQGGYTELQQRRDPPADLLELTLDEPWITSDMHAGHIKPAPLLRPGLRQTQAQRLVALLLDPLPHTPCCLPPLPCDVPRSSHSHGGLPEQEVCSPTNQNGSRKRRAHDPAIQEPTHSRHTRRQKTRSHPGACTDHWGLSQPDSPSHAAPEHMVRIFPVLCINEYIYVAHVTFSSPVSLRAYVFQIKVSNQQLT